MDRMLASKSRRRKLLASRGSLSYGLLAARIRGEIKPIGAKQPRGLSQNLGPYLVLALLVPCGSVLAVLLFLYQRFNANPVRTAQDTDVERKSIRS